MCGISGIYAFNEEGKNSLNSIEKSVQALNKRGPNNTGVYTDKQLALGHARLAIIDVSQNANQPFTDSSGNYTIVYNGEIFNYKILKESLRQKGASFKSESDTEVLLKLFQLEGAECLKKLDGFFSFAIYDKNKQELFIARDRYGIKPLVYSIQENFFCFASEIKALLEFKIPKKINKAALMQFFHLNYIAGNHTIFQDIYKLEPGHYGVLNKSGFNIQRYYSLESGINQTSYDVGFEENCKKLYNLLDDAVRVRMISDVPLGAFLSGGIDSSVVTALASRYTGKLNTFSIGFKDEPLFDETAYATLVANKYKTNHTVFSLSNQDLFENLNEMLDYFDEPFADSSALNVYILCKNTRNKVTVALSGDGADEMFAGYNKHAAAYAILNNQYLINQLKFFNPILKKLPQSRNSKMGNLIRQLSKLTEGAYLSHADRYWLWAGFYNHKQLLELFTPTFVTEQNIETYQKNKNNLLSFFGNNSEKQTMQQILLSDMKIVLTGDMLPKVDLMSMANSFEVRPPFLDHKVVDFVFGLPDKYKINANNRKIILKETFKDLLPNEIFNRSKKGFEVPLLKWFQTDLKALITEDLLSRKMIEEQQIFNYETIDKLLKKLFSANPGDSVAKVWALIVFQYWYKKYYL